MKSKDQTKCAIHADSCSDPGHFLRMNTDPFLCFTLTGNRPFTLIMIRPFYLWWTRIRYLLSKGIWILNLTWSGFISGAWTWPRTKMLPTGILILPILLIGSRFQGPIFLAGILNTRHKKCSGLKKARIRSPDNRSIKSQSFYKCF